MLASAPRSQQKPMESIAKNKHLGSCWSRGSASWKRMLSATVPHSVWELLLHGGLQCIFCTTVGILQSVLHLFFFFFIVFNELCLCEAAILIHSLCVASLETKKN